MTKPSPIVWRIASVLLWIASVGFFIACFGESFSAEKLLYNNPHLTAADQISIQHSQTVADRWSAIGWLLQFAAAAVLSFGLRFPRVVRRIFVSLGVLIAVDGVTLLLMAVIIH